MTNVLDVLSDLHLVEYSVDSHIERSAVEWPAMRDFLGFWRRFEARNGDSFNDSELELRKAVLRFIRTCNAVPLSPQIHQDLAEELEAAIVRSAETSAQNRSDTLQLGRLLEGVLRSTNPASGFLEDWIASREVIECPEEHVRKGEPCVTLVLRDEAERGLATRWIEDQELFASTATYREVRKGHAFKYLVFFGTPDRYVLSAWLRSPSSWYQSQWLVTAPAASISLFLSWPGHSKWQDDLLGPWMGSESVVIRDVSPELYEVEEFLLDIEEPFLPESSVEPEIKDHKQELIPAIGYELVTEGGYDWIYFSDAMPPRPRTISSNREQIDFLKPGQLRPGVMLIVNDETERPAILDDYARRYWLGHYGGHNFDRAEELKRDLKRKVKEAIDNFGKDEMVRRMASSGLDAEYARTILGSLLAEDYIAPRRRDAIDHLRAAGEFKLAPDSNVLLRHLRVSRQKAGIEINELLRRKLVSSEGDEAMDAAERQGWGYLDTPDLGRIAVHRVAAYANATRSVPRSWLGRLRERS